jgi:hypothetical protein
VVWYSGSPLISTSFKVFRRDFSSSLPIVDINEIAALCTEKDTRLNFQDNADKRYDFFFLYYKTEAKYLNTNA